MRYNLFFLIVCLTIITACQRDQSQAEQELKVIRLQPERAAQLSQEIREEVPAEIADGLELSLWASDSLAPDPIALAMDEQGRAYITRTIRQKNSEFDIRGHMQWATPSIMLKTVEDRRQFLRDTLSPERSAKNEWLEDLNGDGSHDWRDLTIEKEQVYLISDESGDGIADVSQLFIEDFNEEITDVAGAVLPYGESVYLGVAPDMWRLQDTDGDNIVDKKESISHGYAIHVGFSGHGMSGLTVGPDGKIYWGIGDIGANIVDQDGNKWEYPNQGVVVRANPDGSDFEVFAAGVRNTHEFVFDKYGNIISVDNDGDHPGEKERLVYITNGSDSGWRANWQYGKYTDPKNNEYKVWMDEDMFKPRFAGQAAYITPPVANYHSGPAGMKYNPGTALGEKWQDKFFISEFTGSPARSNIYAFELKPKGATFEFVGEEKVVNGVLATGIDFGPDGALYIADWIDGWGTKDYGRIWKLDAPDAEATALRKETKALISSDFVQKSDEELSNLLHHADMRVRSKAHTELAARGEAGKVVLLAAAEQTEHELARIHGLWGIWQLANDDLAHAAALVPFLQDENAEIRAQAAKIIGDVRYGEAGAELISLLQDESARVRFFAAEALGRTAHKAAVQPIIDMLAANNDQDAYLRHAGSLALARIGEAEPVLALADSPNRGLRIAAVVTLRRMKHPGIEVFLQDSDEFIVTETARAINDDLSIEEALPALANLLNETTFTNEPLLRRVINANSRVGKAENVQMLVDFAARKSAPEAMRAEALATLAVWANPSVLDRVDGRYRGEVERDAAPVMAALEQMATDLLTENNNAVQVAAAKAVSQLDIQSTNATLYALLQNNASENVRTAALETLSELEFDNLSEALELALTDQSGQVRRTALSLIPRVDIPENRAVELFTTILENGSMEEQQTALLSVGKLSGEAATQTLDRLTDDLLAGQLEPALKLELEEAIKAHGKERLTTKLENYYAEIPEDDMVAKYQASLVGGDAGVGRRIFGRNNAAQCIRCHSVFEYGGDVGPGLSNIGAKYGREKLLESMVAPSATIAPGYGVATLTLKDGETVAGIIESENETEIILKLGQTDKRTVAKADIEQREDVPSSMPNMADVLDKRQLRDLVEFLTTLREEGTIQ